MLELNRRSHSYDVQNTCNVLGVDLSAILLNSDGTRKCFSGQIDPVIYNSYYYFEIALRGCGTPSKQWNNYFRFIAFL